MDSEYNRIYQQRLKLGLCVKGMFMAPVWWVTLGFSDFSSQNLRFLCLRGFHCPTAAFPAQGQKLFFGGESREMHFQHLLSNEDSVLQSCLLLSVPTKTSNADVVPLIPTLESTLARFCFLCSWEWCPVLGPVGRAIKVMGAKRAGRNSYGILLIASMAFFW